MEINFNTNNLFDQHIVLFILHWKKYSSVHYKLPVKAIIEFLGIFNIYTCTILLFTAKYYSIGIFFVSICPPLAELILKY